jgi:DNA-binding NtrC family response regulator
MREKCVLVIDRDWRLRKLIRANLEPLHLRVREAINEQHGLKRLEEHQPDLILVGVDAADREVLEVLQLQASARQVPIIVMSPEPLSRLFLQHSRVVGYLLVPFAARDLVAEVEKALVRPPSGNQASRLQ